MNFSGGTTLFDSMIPVWYTSKAGLYPPIVRGNTLSALRMWDAFFTEDNIASGSTTAKWNGTEYILPEASGGSWSSFTALTGTFADPCLAVNTSEQVALIFVDESATPDNLQFNVRNADETQLTATTNVATSPSGNLAFPKAIGVAANFWFSYLDVGTSNAYLTVVNNAGAVQFSLTQDEVNTSIVTTDIDQFTAPASNGTRAFVFGTSSARDSIFYAAYAISDGTKDLSSRDLGVDSNFDYINLFALGDATNKLIYLIYRKTTAASSETFSIEIAVLNNDGDIIKKVAIPVQENATLVSAAISDDKTRIALGYTFNGGVSNGQQVMMVDTTTLHLVGSSIVAIGTTSGASLGYPTMYFGPGDRAWTVGLIASDVYYAIINKDGSIFKAATQIAAETVDTPAIIYNPDNTNNKIWNTCETTGDNDIQFRTYDFLFDTAAGGFTVQSNAVTLDNTISRGVTTWLEVLPSSTSIDLDVSVDNGSNFDTTITKDEINEYSNTGTQVVLKATLKSTVDFSTPELQGWAFVGERT